MNPGTIPMALSVLLCVAAATLLYLSAPKQRLVDRPPARRPTLLLGLLALFAGVACAVLAWGGLVGPLAALGVWMTASVALPYACALRRQP